MALTPGQNLISSSENDKKSNRRNLSFDPFVGATKPSVDPGFFQGLRDLTTNLAFNVVDSALMGIPGRKLEQGAETVREGFFDRPRRTFGEAWESLGIKPYEELSGAGKFGLGLGQAAGFFIPFSGISKVSRVGQKFAFGNANKLIGETVENAIKGTASSNPLRSIIKNTIQKEADRLPHIFRAGPEQAAKFESTLLENVRLAATKFSTDNGLKIAQKEIDGISSTIVKAIKEQGQNGKFIDDLEGLTAGLGRAMGDNAYTRTIAGYAGRAIDQSVNMAVYEGLGHLSRAAAGATYDDIDYDLLESMKNSAGFAAAITLADFIPGGRKAGAVQDFYRFARQSLGKNRDWVKLYRDGKINKDQLNSIAAWLSRQGKTLPNAGTKTAKSRGLEVGQMEGEAIAKWMNEIYSKNRTELLRAIIKDGGKSVVHSLPRAAVDGLITATYMNGKENFMNALHDESMIADYLVGAFMAMRAYSPLDRRKQMRWRYDTSIDSKFNFMEQMGMDVSHIAGNAEAMNRVMLDIDMAARNLETTSSSEEIYSALYKERGAPVGESAGSNMKERALADQLMKKFIPMYIKRNDVHNIDEIQLAFEKGVVPNVYNMSDAQFSDMWNDLKDIQTPEGKSIAEYSDLGIDRWREDYEAPIYKNHIDSLVLHAKRAANEINKIDSKGEFVIADNTAEGGKLRLRRITGNINSPELAFFVDSFKELEKGDIVEFDKNQSSVDITQIDDQIVANLKKITDDYMNDSADFFGSNLNYSAFDNPALDYISEYNNLKVKNKVEDAILGNVREGNRIHEAITDAISSKIGETVSGKGVRIKLTDEEDPNIPAYNRLVTELVEMKRAAAKTNSSDSIKEISLEDARDLYNDLENLGYMHYSKDNDMIYFGNKSSVEFRTMLHEGVIARSGLNRTDFVVLNYIKDEFGETGGKVQMPSMKYAEQVLRENLANFQSKDILSEKEMGMLTPTLREYQKALDRMSKTGRIQIVNSRTGDESNNTMESVIYAIRDIYDAEARGEIHDMAKLSKEKVAKYNAIMKKLSEFIDKEYSAESMENVQEVAKYISDHAAEITEASNLFTNDQGKKRKGFTEVLAQAERIATRQASDISNEAFLNRIFNEVFEGIGEVEDMSRAVAKLASVEKSKIGFGVSAQKLRSDLLKIYDERTRKEMENKPLEEAFIEFASRRGVAEAKQLVEQTYRYINTDSNISDHLFVGESSTKDMMDMLRFYSGSNNSANKQSFVSRLKSLNLNHLLDKQDLSSNIVDGLVDPTRVADTVDNLIKEIKSNSTEAEFRKESKKIFSEIIATVGTLSRRNQSYRTAKLQGNSFVFNGDEKSVHTPIGEFTNTVDYDVFIVKDTMVIDGVPIKITDMNLDEARQVIFNATASIEKSVFENLRDREKFAGILEVAKSGDQTKFPIFVPLQSNEDVGVVFSKTEDNVRRLKEEFNHFSRGLYKEAKEFGRLDALQMHLNVIDGMLKNNSDDGISAAIRAMYYHKNISKDMFWQMIGEGTNQSAVAESARRGQIKNFKYISHVNSKNAISFDRQSLNLIEKATDKIKEHGTVDKDIITELKRRQKDGIRVFVYNDEAEDANGNRVKGTTAYDIISHTVQGTLDDLGIVGSQRAEMEQRLVESTARDYGMDSDAESLKQSIVDGVSFASKSAMKLDTYLMGKDFNEGVTAAKVQFHNARDSFIGKTAVRFNQSMESFMKDKGIDYIVPASSAKSWLNKDKVNKVSSWDSQKTVGDNIKDQFTSINEFSLRSFDPETIKYLYPTHGGERPQSNTNTSVMHFLDELAISDYTNQLGIDQVVQSISRHVANGRAKMFTGGIEGLFNRNNEGTDTYFSHYSAIEQMIKWGIDSDNSLIRDSIARFVRDTEYKSLLSKPRTDVVNTFLFTDSTLKSAIYESSGTAGHVKSFGEIKLPYYSAKESISSDTSYIFSLVRNGDFQDVILNAGKGELKLHSPNKNFDISDLTTNNQLTELYRELNNYNDYGSVDSKLKEINLVLSGKADSVFDYVIKDGVSVENVKNETLTNLALSLRDKGLRNFSLASNSHKIPKKFAADSIVNRIRGFNDESVGDLIEVNNYETALQHQADQDGDKLTSYMKMPFSVLRSSSNNMALAKDAITIDPNNVSFPNVFGTITNDDNITSIGDTGSARGNNPLKYMSNERRSKYVVGTTVKTQGSFTMLDITGMKFLGKSIMNFGNSDGSDFGKSSDFARITGSITQSILDAWNGVHDSLLSSRKIKDYLLFGEKADIPVDKIPKTLPVDEGFQGIFPINETGARGNVYKDFVREIYNAFEDVYTSLGDIYEGGVANKPEFHHLARSYYNLKNLMNKDSSYVFNKLAARYKRQNRWTELNFLKDQFQSPSNRSTEATIKTIFSFDKSFDDMIKIHPQLKALHEIVQQGDLLRNNDYQINETDAQKFFDYKEGSIMTRIMGSKDDEFASTILALNDGAVIKILDNLEKLDGVSPNHARNLGLINHVLDNKINQLQYSKNFYERTNNTDAIIDTDIELSLLREKQREVKNKIYKTVKSTFVNDANIVDVINNYKNNNENNVWLYKDTGSSYEFVKVLRPGEYAPGWIKGKGFVLQNPVELKPLNEKQQIEGFAMHNAVDDFYDSIARAKNGNLEKTNEVVGLLRQKIEMAKASLREINSDTFDSLAKIPAMKSDIYDQNAIYTHLEMEKFLHEMRDFAEQNNISHTDVLKAALSPRLIPNEIVKDGNVEVNSFKIDKKFTMALIKHINDNTSELVSDYKLPLETIMTNYASKIQIGNGIQPEGKHSGTYVDKNERLQDFREANQANSLFHSLNKMAQDDIMLRRAIEGMTFTRKKLNDDGTVTKTARNIKKKQSEIGCKLI